MCILFIFADSEGAASIYASQRRKDKDFFVDNQFVRANTLQDYQNRINVKREKLKNIQLGISKTIKAISHADLAEIEEILSSSEEEENDDSYDSSPDTSNNVGVLNSSSETIMTDDGQAAFEKSPERGMNSTNEEVLQEPPDPPNIAKSMPLEHEDDLSRYNRLSNNNDDINDRASSHGLPTTDEKQDSCQKVQEATNLPSAIFQQLHGGDDHDSDVSTQPQRNNGGKPDGMACFIQEQNPAVSNPPSVSADADELDLEQRKEVRILSKSFFISAIYISQSYFIIYRNH